jgi:hypothetical protein
MGQSIDRHEFTPEEHARFAQRLLECLDAFRTLLARPGFGVGSRTVGAELEVHLVDRDGHATPGSTAVLERTEDPRLTAEIDRFNLECTVRPAPLAGRPFAQLAGELETALAEMRKRAAEVGARVVPVGVLPTLRREDLGLAALTQSHRHRALTLGLRGRRSGPFHIRIEGEESLALDMDDVSAAGACTSAQFHLKVDPADFARVHNASQLATAPALALAGNSPLFLGKRLWQETRIALYRQATDGRSGEEEAYALPVRTTFGHGWVREGPHELYAQAVALYPTLMPVMSGEDPRAVVAAGGLPHLDELRLHQGTVYMWNRAIFDPVDGGHVRVELRALPSGPTVVDTLANGAFLMGLTLALSGEVEQLLPGLPFRLAADSFHAAAREGLEARLRWPFRLAPSPRPIPVRELLPGLLGRAELALVEAGVMREDVAGLFDVLRERLRSGRTGARWQLETVARLEAQGRSRESAVRGMLERYLEHAATGAPVHSWPVG